MLVALPNAARKGQGTRSNADMATGRLEENRHPGGTPVDLNNPPASTVSALWTVQAKVALGA